MMLKLKNQKLFTELTDALICFVCYIVMSTVLRLFSTEKLSFAEDWGYVVTLAGLFSLTAFLFKFQKKIFSLFFLIIGVYLFAMGIKVLDGMILPEREIIHTFGFSTLLWAGIVCLAYPLCFAKNTCLQNLGKFFLSVIYVIIILMPMSVIGYFIANHAILSSDILLTLFQTNLNEISAYLSDQNKVFWGIGILVILLVLYAALYLWKKICLSVQKNWYTFAILFVMVIHGYVHILPRININFVFNIFYSTFQTLSNFQKYSDTQQLRLERISNLKNLNLSSKNDGIFVLVIGESETKDHMSAYGYSLATTPHLDDLKNQENVLIFENAYANHTHTIPTLTYALSSVDQYHENELSESYSILEVAKAAGFETYWISNQPKETVFLTPLSVMSSIADHQIWLNSNIGDKILESYHDIKVVDVLDHIHSQKAFVVIHLMGSHGAYKDRYPPAFNRFNNSSKAYINAYDNSVLYTDFVLNKIIKRVREYPNFMSLIYFSDHGDDPDNKLGHESSRFTFTMARIPLIMAFSDRFKDQNTSIYETLSTHQESIWTNDLFYNLMLSVLGITNAPQDKSYDLSDSSYNLTRDRALTLHGTKKLIEEF